MTYPMNYQKQNIPAYSGITINITNPTLNANPLNAKCPHDYQGQYLQHQPNLTVENTNPYSISPRPYNTGISAISTNNENITTLDQYDANRFNAPIITTPQANTTTPVTQRPLPTSVSRGDGRPRRR